MTVQEAPPVRVIISPRRPRRSWWPAVVPAGLGVCALLWLLSLTGARLNRTGGWGLVGALPASWYLAPAGTVLLYVAVLVGRRPVSHVLAAAQVVLTAILFGTTSALYPVPRYPWTFKHIGEVQYLLQHGGVDRSIDIYQNFPGFFYLAAGVHVLTGIPVQGMAQWAQPVFAVATALGVYWVAGGLSRSRRVRYGTVLVYTLGDWIGQNYFSPQALAFPLSLFLLGGLLRSVPRGSAGARWPALGRWLQTSDDADLPRPSAFWTSRRGTAVLVAVFALIVVCHPLSPIVLLAQVTLVCVFLRPARPWLALVFLVIEEAWLLQAWPFLFSTYHLFDFSVDNVAPPQVSFGDPLPGHAAALWAAPLLMGLVGLLAAASALVGIGRRRTGRLLVPASLALVPAALVLAQPYGHEGIFRAFLFALPFGAFVIALEFFGRRRTWGRRWPVLPAVVVLLLAALEVPALFSEELTNQVLPSDVAADVWFEQQTPTGSTLLPFTANFPFRSTADYAGHRPPADEGLLGVTDREGFLAAATSEQRLLDFTVGVCRDSVGQGPVYLAVGPFSERSVRLLGTVEPTAYQGYLAGLHDDPRFVRVFTDGPSELYRCR